VVPARAARSADWYALPTGAALLWRGASAPPRLRALAPVATFAIGVGLFAGLCVVYFWRFFGAPFVIPNEAVSGQAFVGAPLRFLPQVLFDRNNGWLTWSPIASLGLLGLMGIVIVRSARAVGSHRGPARAQPLHPK
jgi:hypothetical protein